MNKEELEERRLLRESQERQMGVIRHGSTDSARVEVSFLYADDPTETDHCGWFAVHCGPDKWTEADSERTGEPYSPYVAAHELVVAWFESRPNEYSWHQIDEIYAL